MFRPVLGHVHDFILNIEVLLLFCDFYYPYSWLCGCFRWRSWYLCFWLLLLWVICWVSALTFLYDTAWWCVVGTGLWGSQVYALFLVLFDDCNENRFFGDCVVVRCFVCWGYRCGRSVVFVFVSLFVMWCIPRMQSEQRPNLLTQACLRNQNNLTSMLISLHMSKDTKWHK